MRVVETPLPGVKLIEPAVFGDQRGFFQELWNQQRYAVLGIEESFVQDNLSYSQKDVLRGLHFQYPAEQGKLVSVLFGEVFDVAVDIRLGSPTFCQWVGFYLNAETKYQLYIPPGFAHGFCVMSLTALFLYKCTDFYNPATEAGIRWNDRRLKISWPIKAPILSDKDLAYPQFEDIYIDRLPKYKG